MIFYSVARENGVPQIKGTKEQQQAAKNDVSLRQWFWQINYEGMNTCAFSETYNVLTMKNTNRARSSRFQN